MACRFDNHSKCTKPISTCCIECVARGANDCGLSYFCLCDYMDTEYAEDCNYYVKDRMTVKEAIKELEIHYIGDSDRMRLAKDIAVNCLLKSK